MLSKVKLNGTDLVVSQMCYGTNILGTAVSQDQANLLLDRFVELGGNFLDTARGYGDWVPDAPSGASERAIGAWLKGRKREDVVIATKGGMFDMRKGDWKNRCNPQDVAQDLSESLDHLGVDTIDLYFLHVDNPDAPVEAMIDALVGHQEAGRIRYFAASNWAADRVKAANAYARSIGKSGFAASETFWGLAVPNEGNAVQQGYQHYYEGEYEELHASGLPIIAYGAQSGGYFTKMDKDGTAGDMLNARYDHPANAKRLAVARELAGKHGVSINEIVLAFMLNQPGQTIPIFGGSRVEQIEDSVKAASVKLSADELAQLRAY